MYVPKYQVQRVPTSTHSYFHTYQVMLYANSLGGGVL